MHPARRSLLISPQVDFEAILRAEARIGAAKKSRNTIEAYSLGWRAFCVWCEAAGASPLPADPGVVKNFATWCLEYGYRIRTVTLRLTAISHYHREAGHPSPLGKEIWRHIENAKRHFKEEPGGKRAITSEMLRKMIGRIPDTVKGIRDRAMILLTFAAGWRKTETGGLNFSDLRFVSEGVELWLRSSKTDQIGEGRLVGIHPGENPITCPVLAIRAWLAVRGTWDGPLFSKLTARQEVSRHALGRRGQVIYFAVKKYLDAIGEDPKFFGAHSLRSGMITEASKHGASEASIMQRTGHKCSATLRRYIRPATAFDFNPLKGVL